MTQVSTPFGGIFKNVLDAMKDAEELGGPEGQDYIEFMEAIIAEARRRIEAYRAAAERPAIKGGYRFRLTRDVDRFPDFIAPAGLTGTVTVVMADDIWGRMDQPVIGAEQWDNELHWESLADFLADTEPLRD